MLLYFDLTACVHIGNYIILSLSLAYGRRPVFLISTVILFSAIIGSALQDSYEGHLATRVVAGLATGATESLLPLMLTEVTFLHERGRIFGVYWMVQNALSSALNLASSYESATLGWRWYYWVYAIAVGTGAVAAALGALETRFARPTASLDGRVVVTDEFGVTHVVPDAEAQKNLARLERAGVASVGGGGGADGGGDAPRPKTYRELLKPWDKPHAHPLTVIVQSWLRMLQSATSPAIIYAVLISSITLGCGVAISLTYDAVLQSYGWSAASIGLVNIGGVIGAVVGMLFCTFVGEPLMVWMARRNKGVHLPEHWLLILIVPAILGFASLLLYGFTAAGGSTWWGPYIGWTLNQISFTCVLIVSATFASEASPKHPGPALVVIVGTKNVISFGVTYGLTPMVEKHGYRWAFGVLSGIFMA
jgi:MFS family permease